MNKLMLKISAVALAATLATGVAYAGGTTVIAGNWTSSSASANHWGTHAEGQSGSIVIASGHNGSGSAGGEYGAYASSKKKSGSWYGHSYSKKTSEAYGGSHAEASVGCGCGNSH
jgi:hypothetical protein